MSQKGCKNNQRVGNSEDIIMDTVDTNNKTSNGQLLKDVDQSEIDRLLIDSEPLKDVEYKYVKDEYSTITCNVDGEEEMRNNQNLFYTVSPFSDSDGEEAAFGDNSDGDLNNVLEAIEKVTIFIYDS